VVTLALVLLYFLLLTWFKIEFECLLLITLHFLFNQGWLSTSAVIAHSSAHSSCVYQDRQIGREMNIVTTSRLRSQQCTFESAEDNCRCRKGIKIRNGITFHARSCSIEEGITFTGHKRVFSSGYCTVCVSLDNG